MAIIFAENKQYFLLCQFNKKVHSQKYLIFILKFSLYFGKLIQYYNSIGKDQTVKKEAMTLKSKNQISITYNKIIKIKKKQLLTRKLTKRYRLISRIGKGGFGQVYKAFQVKKPRNLVAIKVPYSINSHHQSLRQIAALRKLQKYQRFPKIQNVHIHNQHIFIVQNFIKQTNYKTYFYKLEIQDMRYYFYELLKAIQTLHKLQFLHRDIKPSNFIYNQKTKRGTLIDFGLLTIGKNGQGNLLGNIIGTKAYLPLQVLLKVQPYSTRSEVWSVGVIMLQIVCRKYYIFENYSHTKIKKVDNCGQAQYYIVKFIMKLAILNKQKIVEQLNKFGYQLKLPQNLQSLSYQDIATIKGYDEQLNDLLYRMLDINPETRITVDQALAHSFFEQVRKQRQK